MKLFPHIVQQYYPLLTRFTRRIILNDVAAEDLPAAIFNQLYTALPDIHTKKQLHQFLITATRMACHAWLHQQALLLQSQSEAKHSNNNNDSSTLPSPRHCDPPKAEKQTEGLGVRRKKTSQ